MYLAIAASLFPPRRIADDPLMCALVADLVTNGLPRFHTRRSRSSDPPCPICLQPGEGMVARLRCRHVFHRECIEEWLVHRDTCPLCRTTVTSACRD